MIASMVPAPRQADNEIEEVSYAFEWIHKGRATMLVELGSKGHVRCTSLMKPKEDLVWHCHTTPWHGSYNVGAHLMLSFSWRHPSKWLQPHRLFYNTATENWYSEEVFTIAARDIYKGWLLSHPHVEELDQSRAA